MLILQYRKKFKKPKTNCLDVALSGALHESGNRSALLGPRLTKTEVYFPLFISTQNHTIAG